MVIWQCIQNVTYAQEIWRRILKRLDTWEAVKHHMMVQDMSRICEKCLSVSNFRTWRIVEQIYTPILS